MKKLLNLTVLLTTSLFLNQSASAQLSGTKIIGQTSPSDYTSFTAAVSALNAQGVNGHVTFLVQPGTYTEKISLNQINGASANKTITFISQTGDSTSVILQSPSASMSTANYVVQLNGSDYITFKNMTIRRTDVLNYAVVIDMKSGAKHNSFINNVIEGNTVQGTSAFKALVTSDNLAKECYNTFHNNIFRNGDIGLYFLGQDPSQPDTCNVISYNKFINQAYRSIFITNQLNLVIKGNTISSTSLASNFYAIYAQYSNDTMRIVKNNITLATGIGIYLANCNEISTERGLIANNFVSINSSATANGIYLNLTKNQDVYYNSVHIYSSSTTSGVAFNVSGSSTNYIAVKNNVFANTGGGFTYFVAASAPAGCIMASDYNDLYTTGTYIGSWRTDGSITTLANWRTKSGLEMHSISINPMFTSNTDLHAHNGAINGLATPYINPLKIGDDIDNNLRNATTPDMGADEFTMEDLGVTKILINPAGYCPGANFNVKITIRNLGASSITGNIPVYYRIGSSPIVNSSTSNVTIASGDSMVFEFTNFQSISTPGTYRIHAGTSFSSDVNYINDTINRPLIIEPLPNASAGANTQVCLGKTTTITASGGVHYVWNVTPLQQTASIQVAPLVPTKYYVTVTTAAGCTDTASVLVTPVTLPVPAASFTYIPSGLQISFNNSSTNASNYNWTFGDGGNSTLPNPVHTYSSGGNYAVRLISANVCASDTSYQTISLSGIDENAYKTTILLHPNPATDYIYIDSQENDAVILIITDINGQTVHNTTMIGNKIDVSALNTGLYFVKIIDNKGNITQGRFIKH